jgi:hypothetical protein
LVTPSPGSALLTAIGPIIDCGPLPGLSIRSLANVSIGTPGCNSLRKCDQVSGKLIESAGGSSQADSPLRMGRYFQ